MKEARARDDDNLESAKTERSMDVGLDVFHSLCWMSGFTNMDGMDERTILILKEIKGESSLGPRQSRPGQRRRARARRRRSAQCRSSCMPERQNTKGN